MAERSSPLPCSITVLSTSGTYLLPLRRLSLRLQYRYPTTPLTLQCGLNALRAKFGLRRLRYRPLRGGLRVDLNGGHFPTYVILVGGSFFRVRRERSLPVRQRLYLQQPKEPGFCYQYVGRFSSARHCLVAESP